MARVGLKRFRFSYLDENDDVIEPQSLARAIDCKVSLENNSAELYADDELIESDYSFSKGTVSITADDDEDEVFAPLLGHEITPEYVETKDITYNSEKKYYTKSNNTYSEFSGTEFADETTYYEKSDNAGEVIRRDTDIAPYIAFGRILTKLVNGEYKYKVEFLSKVKFKDSMPDEKTKSGSTEFTTIPLEGTVMKKSNGDWSRTKTFKTFTEASNYLDKLLTKTV